MVVRLTMTRMNSKIFLTANSYRGHISTLDQLIQNIHVNMITLRYCSSGYAIDMFILA